ncbi:glycosyltransferase family 1 protein [Bacillus pacificus]|uniref:glycosyltransferase family 1 protein n=1 Tax=Bacillus pacificus TaxID=2026187 RepID=UPI003D227ED7
MSEMEGKQRVLHIVSAMNRGGAETLLMSIYRKIDRDRVQFDFVSHRSEECDFDGEIKEMGGKIFHISSLGQKGPWKYIKQLVKIMSQDQYVAVHVHTDYQGGVVALAAKIAGIKKRICHSHSNNWLMGSGVKAKVTLQVLKLIIKYAATDYCACSTEAATFLFGNRAVKKNRVYLLKNGIDVDQFSDWNMEAAYHLKRELQIPDKSKIIGHIGNFSESKNHFFILRILERLLQKDKNFVAVLVGDGPLRNAIELKAREMGIANHIWFLGVRSDIPRILQIFDVLLFPSLFEGFGIVTLEAQCSGVSCVVSDNVPQEVDMGANLVTFIHLEEELNVWLEEICKSLLKEKPEKSLIANHISNLGYDINSNILNWLSLYGIHEKECI